jgi:predicted nucleic acid-binding Zn ribbon protein
MQSLQQAMADLEASSQWRSQALLRNILRVWPQVVGTAVAQHSRPTGLQKQVLQVRVTSAAWSQTLTFERLQILDKLRPHLPPAAVVNDIRFSPGRWSTSTSAPPGGYCLCQPSQSFSCRDCAAPARSPRQRDRRLWPVATPPQPAKRSANSLAPIATAPARQESLARWSVCSICAAHQWQSTLGQARDRERSQP